jgi:hypothetical protein
MRMFLMLSGIATLLGCADDAAPSDTESQDASVSDLDAATETPEARCTRDLERCDVREAACQETLALAVGCLRDRKAGMPEVRLIGEADYAEMLLQDSAQPASTAAAQQQQRWFDGIASFGLATAGTSGGQRAEDRAARTGAVYRYATRDIVLIDRGMKLDDEETVTTLAHEMVHAQQDSERDLKDWARRYATTDDRALAAASVYEGEATHYQALIAHALHDEVLDEAEWDARYEAWQAEDFKLADEHETAYTTAHLSFPYAFGGALVTHAWLQDGQAAIDALYDDPPLSTRAIMFGTAEGEAQAMTLLQQAALPLLSIDFTPVSYTSLGAFMFRAFLRHHGLDEEAALGAAESLGADVFSVQYQRDTEELVSAWRVHLLDGADTAWVDDLELDGIAVMQSGSQLSFVAAEPAVRAELNSWRWIPLPSVIVMP